MAQLQSTGITGSLQALIGGAIKFNVTSSGVTIGNAITDINSIFGSVLITGSSATVGTAGFSYLAAGAGPSAWSTGGALITARRRLAGAGTQNQGLAFGGFSPGNVQQNATEEYNGSTWATGGNLITGRFDLAGAGTQNEGLAVGGGATEEYNGTSWSGATNLINSRSNLGATGTQNEALAFGGGGTSSTTVTCTEEYNGTSWSAGGALISTRYLLAGAGTQNLGLAFGGIASYARLSCTEEYDGTSWATGGGLITARDGLGQAGTQNSALGFGGSLFGYANTEEYNGTSWASRSSLINGRSYLGSGTNSTANSALAVGGCDYYRGFLSCTEEFSPSDAFLTSFQYCGSNGVVVLPLVSSSLNFADDAAAAAGGVAVGGLYRNGGLVQIRVT